MKNKLVCISGLCGAGKSIVSDIFVKAGYQYLRFGQITLDEVKKRGLAPTEANERPIREGFRQQYGMGAFAILNLPKIEELLKKGNLIGDGLYSFAEYKVLKEKFKDDFILIAVYAPPKIRYARLEKRKLATNDTNLRDRPMTKEEAISRDYAEIEKSDKGGPIAIADFTIMNTKDLDFLKKQVEEVMHDIGQQ